ncbi:hypothetical protein, partial [Burkholderia mallei]|uniref:hypothetical protein n=1 Tax=Burkholderia mallei TaxID=13373 RepID=UPI001C53F948
MLQYVYYIRGIEQYRPWIKQNLASVGLSSSKAIVINKQEDKEQSKRVTFRIITNADEQLQNLA